MSETRLTAVPNLGPTHAMIGAVLGNYRITGELSRGGMGAVFTARHELLGRPAAVKLLRPDLTSNDELVQRFFNEAKAATAIRHPGIVEVFDFGYTDEGHAFLVMELLDGRPLGRALQKVGRFTELEAANIARGIASALKAAHALGIVHRDLKPDNIFLVPDLDGPTGGVRTKVLDFGIAKLSHDTTNRHHTQTGVMLGTPLYMAPEQARAAAAIDHRADLYSLGCILYELLVGAPPFLGEGAGEVIAMQMFSPPQPPRERVGDISPEMERIVLRLLAKEPHERFQTAAELISALAAIGARLSADFVAASTSGSYAKMAGQPPTMREPAPMVAGPVGPVAGPLIAATHIDRPPRSKLPLVAGAITLVIAGAVIAFVALRSSGDDVIEASPAPPKPELAPVQPQPVKPPPKRVIVETPKPAPANTETRDVIVVDDPLDRKPAAGNAKTKPDKKKPVIKGPTTDNGSPIELDLDIKKKTPP